MEVRNYRVRNIKGAWYAVIDYTDEGRRRQRSKKLDASSEEDAKCKAMEWYVRCKSGLETLKKNGSRPAIEYAREYFSGRLERREYERSTYATNLKHLRAWERKIGSKPLDRITSSEIKNTLAEWFAEGRDATTVDKRITCLNEVFKAGIDDGLCSMNPFDSIKRPKKGWKELNGVNDKAVLLEVSEGIRRLPLEWPRIAFSVALLTGMRRGEICAIRWRDVDLDKKSLWVRHAISADDLGRYEKLPKSDKPRDIALPDELAELLDTWRLECMYSHGSEFVISEKDGSPVNPDNMTHSFTALSRFNGWKGAAGRRLTLHDLRHTTATVLISNGADVKTVQSVLGHSSAAITLDMYASADSGAKKKAAALLGDALRPA